MNDRRMMTAQEKFWNWFVQHEAELFSFEADRESDRERIFDELAGALHDLDPNLTFEFGPKGTKREFVISAGGIKSAFSAVISLVNDTPHLDRWQVTAFRPRRSVCNVVQFRGKRINPKDVQFTLLDNGKMAGIYLFIAGFREEDSDLKQIGYLLLDEALGEYDVEMRLGFIKMLPPETQTSGERSPLIKLPELFDRLVSRLEGRSGTVS
jgi:hypothetical protein